MLLDSIIHYILGLVVHLMLSKIALAIPMHYAAKQAMKLKGVHALKGYMGSCLHMCIGIMSHAIKHLLHGVL